MAVKIEQILAHLEHCYPDHVIYPETYTIRRVGAVYQIGIRHLAKEEKLTPAQWLQEHGFIWRETGYVEPDMRPNGLEFNKLNSLTLADSIMRCCPLVGAYQPSAEEADALYVAAQRTVKKLCRLGERLSAKEELILTLVRRASGHGGHVFLAVYFSPVWIPARKLDFC